MIVDLIGSLWCILCLSLRWTHVFKLESPCDLIIADNSCIYQEHYCDYKLYLLYDIITLWLNPHHYFRRCYFSIRKHIDTLKIPENNNSYFTFTLLNIFFCDYFIDFLNIWNKKLTKIIPIDKPMRDIITGSRATTLTYYPCSKNGYITINN